MRRFRNTILSIILVIIYMCSFLGCSNLREDEQGITISGSSAMLPLIENSILGFEEKYPGFIINAQAGGSGTGITQVYDEIVDIGMSDVYAEEKIPKSKAQSLNDNIVALQGFCIVVNNSLDIESLSKEEIKDIFSGNVTNWKDVNGPDKEIFVIHRAASSGTRSAFVNSVLDGDKSLEDDSIGAIQDSNGAVLKSLKQNDGAISYLSFSYMNLEETKRDLKKIAINGIYPSNENIISGIYPFHSYAHLYTKSEMTESEKKFIDYIMSDENRDKVYEANFIPSKDV